MQGTWLKQLGVLFTQIRQWTNVTDIVVGLGVSSLFINTLALIFPLVLLQIYDRVIFNSATHTLILLSCTVLVALSLEGLLRICRGIITAWTDARIEYLNSSDTFNAILNSNLQNYQKQGTGSLLERINSLNNLKNFYGGQLITTLIDLAFVIFYLGFITYLGGSLVLVPLLMLIILLMVTHTTSLELKETLSNSRKSNDQHTNFIIEILTGIHTIKSMAMEAFMGRRYERLQKSRTLWDYQANLKSAQTSAINAFISQAMIVLIVAFGSIQVINGALTIGGLAACTLLATRALLPINQAMSLWRRFQHISLDAQRADSIKKLSAENNEALPKVTKIESLQLNNVSFQYQAKQAPLLKNINLKLHIGEAIAIDSDGASGKSTLLSLMLGVIKPTTGQVLINDRDINQFDLQNIRRHIGLLPQNSTLFEGTILENLTLFRGKKYNDKAKKIATMLGLDDAINNLPLGYDTQVGNTSVDFLPVGIKQRIAITSALVTEPQVILFDEANRGLDLQADKKLRILLEKLKPHCILVIVSHRPSLLNLADRKFKIRAGKLLELTDNDQSSTSTGTK